MSLSADFLVERLKFKQQADRWKFAVFAIIFIMLLSFVIKSSNDLGGYIARVNIDGIIGNEYERSSKIREIAKDDTIKSLIVYINTPGGNAYGGESLYESLKYVSKIKPVVIIIETLAASAGYMIALSGEHIIARNSSLTGSVGVLVQTFEASDLLDKIGIKPITIKSSPLKNSLSPFEKPSTEAINAAKEPLMDIYQYFIDLVVENRKLSKDEVISIADGRVFTGRQAQKLKLIDEIGGEDEALSWLKKNKNISGKVKDYDISDKVNFISAFQQALSNFNLYSN